MMRPTVGTLPMLRRGIVAYRQVFALRPISTALPSLCHASPCGFVLRTVRGPRHAFALSGMFQKFLIGINRHLFCLTQAHNPNAASKVPSNSASVMGQKGQLMLEKQ
jgi:hypothetical protein